MEAPPKVKSLVQKFKDNYEDYKNPKFDEENLKNEFLNPFFKELGWDVYNEDNCAPQYKEVVFESSIKIGKSAKAPDYAFRLGGREIFYLEAKKPSINIKNDTTSAYQLKRYQWSKQLSGSVLSDFEELSIYAARHVPKEKEPASIDRVKYWTFDEYLTKWDEIYNILSKDAVKSGKWDSYLENKKGETKGTATVDEEFLNEMDKWREKLALNIALRNKQLTINELNYSVQTIIDRIIFLRMAEDKGIEEYKTLYDLTKKENIYGEFCKLCKKADQRYNSGLFHFNESDGNPQSLDRITLNLIIDNKVLKNILKNLYYPNSPYEFSVLSPEILGSVYEQYLGKTIRLTDSHRAKIEYKSETQKNQGIYYTPKYIVDYIAKNTVGKIIKNKTPNQISKIRILDPACGSGSFLLGAYDYLLKYHLDYYNNLEHKPRNAIYTNKEGIVKLTLDEKKRILLNNIYGVDLDSQAVEVTKLSLLLKVLETEDTSITTLDKYIEAKYERILPNLENNIKCGNSLLETDIIETYGLSYEAIKNLHLFNWKEEFNEIFNKDKGFDVVIGNPPYIKERTNKDVFRYLKNSKYYKGKMDFWYFFVCKGLDLLKNNGYLSFIADNNWITNHGASILRNKITSDAKIESYIDFNKYKVFKNASIQTMVLNLKKSSKYNKYSFNYKCLKSNKASPKDIGKFLNDNKDIPTNYESYNVLFNREDSKDSEFRFIKEDIQTILNKISNIENVTCLTKNEVKQGMVLPQDFVMKPKHMDMGFAKNAGIFVITDEEKDGLNLKNNELDLMKPYYTAENLFEYYANPNNTLWVIYTKPDINKKIKEYPNIKKHLDIYKDIITSDNKPYGLHRARDEGIFKGKKIISLRKCSQKPIFTYVPFDSYVSQTYMVIKTDKLNLKTLTGILNSELITFWLKHMGKMQGDNFQVDQKPLLDIPIAVPDSNTEYAIEKLVSDIIGLEEKKANLNLSLDKKEVQHALTSKINTLNEIVYNLYNINDKEQETIQNNIKKQL